MGTARLVETAGVVPAEGDDVGAGVGAGGDGRDVAGRGVAVVAGAGGVEVDAGQPGGVSAAAVGQVVVLLGGAVVGLGGSVADLVVGPALAAPGPVAELRQ